MEFTFHNSYIILELLLNTILLWTEHSCWHKCYSNKATLLLGWSHRYKNVTVITIWLTVTEYLFLKWQWIFYFLSRCFLSSITANTFTGLYCIYNTITNNNFESLTCVLFFASEQLHNSQMSCDKLREDITQCESQMSEKEGNCLNMWCYIWWCYNLVHE